MYTCTEWMNVSSISGIGIFDDISDKVTEIDFPWTFPPTSLPQKPLNDAFYKSDIKLSLVNG